MLWWDCRQERFPGHVRRRESLMRFDAPLPLAGDRARRIQLCACAYSFGIKPGVPRGIAPLGLEVDRRIQGICRFAQRFGFSRRPASQKPVNWVTRKNGNCRGRVQRFCFESKLQSAADLGSPRENCCQHREFRQAFVSIRQRRVSRQRKVWWRRGRNDMCRQSRERKRNRSGTTIVDFGKCGGDV